MTETKISKILVWVPLAAVLVTAVGCSGFTEEARADRAQHEQAQHEGQQAAVQLYEAMVEVFRRDTAGVDLESPRAMTVISDYEKLTEQRRRRFVGRVVPAGSGIGVNITAEYQIDDAEKGESPQWEDQPREVVEAEAQPDELSMARSIERMYHQGETSE